MNSLVKILALVFFVFVCYCCDDNTCRNTDDPVSQACSGLIPGNTCRTPDDKQGSCFEISGTNSNDTVICHCDVR